MPKKQQSAIIVCAGGSSSAKQPPSLAAVGAAEFQRYALKNIDKSIGMI
ncbi:MAG: hypothetical protein NUV74_07590 [Candidatus Brocadiaceae bacterium]|nr:hypothetical protein [Candidatus Brocadiaceae bacterium]